jgi:hypothetical protein
MSEGMLAQAQARSSKVQWLRGPAEQLPFGDGTLDATSSTNPRRCVNSTARSVPGVWRRPRRSAPCNPFRCFFRCFGSPTAG